MNRAKIARLHDHGFLLSSVHPEIPDETLMVSNSETIQRHGAPNVLAFSSLPFFGDRKRPPGEPGTENSIPLISWTRESMAEQLPLFQDEYVLLNDGVAALVSLNLDGAVSALQEYRDLYGNRGNAERMLTMADVLRRGLAACPESGPERPAGLFTFWNSFEASARAGVWGCGDLVAQIRLSFFRFLEKAVEDAGLPDSARLAPQIPIGYVHLRTGRYDRAIRSLQAAIAVSPDNAAIYGYLGDAYFLRGEADTARQVYLEACLIDPEAIDWNHMQDGALTDLKGQLAEEHACAEALACHWLPAHAYVLGLFRPKQIRLMEEFKAFVEGYFALAETARRAPCPAMDARLFLRGIVLCDNETFLRLIKGIDFTDVRRRMKGANPSLFAAYLRRIEDRHNRKPAGPA